MYSIEEFNSDIDFISRKIPEKTITQRYSFFCCRSTKEYEDPIEGVLRNLVENINQKLQYKVVDEKTSLTKAESSQDRIIFIIALDQVFKYLNDAYKDHVWIAAISEYLHAREFGLIYPENIELLQQVLHEYETLLQLTRGTIDINQVVTQPQIISRQPMSKDEIYGSHDGVAGASFVGTYESSVVGSYVGSYGAIN